jgi:hypothetical protein
LFSSFRDTFSKEVFVASFDWDESAHLLESAIVESVEISYRLNSMGWQEKLLKGKQINEPCGECQQVVSFLRFRDIRLAGSGKSLV